MKTEEAQQLLAYGSWANRLMFAAAEALPPGQSEKTIVSSFPSVTATLAHIVGAEWLWLQRWLGDSPAVPPVWMTQTKLSELKGHLDLLEAERSSYVASLAEAEFNRMVTYRSLAGKEFSNRLSDLIRHVVNHSTYHRGQVVTQLRQLGQTPPNTDFAAYVRLLS